MVWFGAEPCACAALPLPICVVSRVVFGWRLAFAFPNGPDGRTSGCILVGRRSGAGGRGANSPPVLIMSKSAGFLSPALRVSILVSRARRPRVLSASHSPVSGTDSRSTPSSIFLRLAPSGPKARGAPLTHSPSLCRLLVLSF